MKRITTKAPKGARSFADLAPLFAMAKRARRKPERLGLSFDVTVILNAYNAAMIQDESDEQDGSKLVPYPETLSIRIESASTMHFDLRLKDMRFIGESCRLSGKGLSLAQVYRIILQDLKEHKQRIDSGKRSKGA